DLDSGADLALGQRWVECGAHPGVGQRVHDGSVHYAMRVEVLLRHVQAELAEAGTMLVDMQGDQFGEGVWHGCADLAVIPGLGVQRSRRRSTARATAFLRRRRRRRRWLLSLRCR